MTDAVRTETRGAVLEITLDRPKANAIDLATMTNDAQGNVVETTAKAYPRGLPWLMMPFEDQTRVAVDPASGDLLAECRLLKLGKRLAVGEVSLLSGTSADPIAHVTATYSIPNT